MKIGYLAQQFPHLTMTFVYREVLALRAYGVDVQTFSTWKPNIDEVSQEARALIPDTFYIFPLDWKRFFLDHVFYLFTRPRRYLGSLLFCLTREHKTLKNRLRTFFHFCEAIPVAAEVERRNINHLHAHFALNATTIALVVHQLTDATFSFTAHANDIFANPILLREKIKAAYFIIAISEFNKKYLYKILPIQETQDKTHVVHCGIDIQEFSPSDKPSSKQTIILAVGRLVEKKGYPFLIQACKVLMDQDYDFQCLIIGDGPQRSLLEQLIEDNCLSDYVNLEGIVFQEALGDYLARADIFVLPCIVASDEDMDGIPNSLMEAMAMEIPVISTSISGIPELIQHEKTGLLVPPRDQVALANAIELLINNQPLRTNLAKNGRIKVIEEFEIEKNTRRLLDVFKFYLENSSH
jgi:glycosyltransferase involved in cell wall biosynthesis